MTDDLEIQEQPMTEEARPMAESIAVSLPSLHDGPASALRTLEVAALQSMAVALSLALNSAVAEQQHGQILRTALTTAAAKAILAGKAPEAKEILSLAESRLVVPDLSAVMSEVKAYLQTIEREMHRHSGESLPA